MRHKEIKEYLDTQLQLRDKIFERALEDFSTRLTTLNNLRQEFEHDRAQFLTVAVYEPRHAALETYIETQVEREHERSTQAIKTLEVRLEDHVKTYDRRIANLESWKARSLGAVAVVVFIITALGAYIDHLLR